jgi:hypothetical protein
MNGYEYEGNKKEAFIDPYFGEEFSSLERQIK